MNNIATGLALLLSLTIAAPAIAQGHDWGQACTGLRGQQQVECQRAQVQAQIAAAQRQQAVAKEKAEMLAILQRQLQEARAPGFLASLSAADLAAYPTKIRSENARVAEIFADLGLPKQDEQTAQAAEAETTDKVAKEQTCRATPQCMTDRQAKALRADMCADIAEIKDMQERISIERANPSGVVDLRELHDDGDTIQRDQAKLATEKSAYAKLTHKSFTASACGT